MSEWVSEWYSYHYRVVSSSVMILVSSSNGDSSNIGQIGGQHLGWDRIGSMRVLLLPPPYHHPALSHYLRAVLNVILALMRSVVLLHLLYSQLLSWQRWLSMTWLSLSYYHKKDKIMKFILSPALTPSSFQCWQISIVDFEIHHWDGGRQITNG